MGAAEHIAQVGEFWAYRARRIDEVVQVEVVKLGTQRRPRVLVRWVDESFEGRQEWVPPTRLKVRWDAVAAFREHEARWDLIDALGIGDEPVYRAAEEVFYAVIDGAVARMDYRECGAGRITDSGRLAELTGLDPAVWSQCPQAFAEGADLVVPWPVTLEIVIAAALRNPSPILEIVSSGEAKAQYEAVHGHWYRGYGSRPDHTVPADICIQVDNEHGKPVRALLRQWCGDTAVARFDELAELRKEIHRVGQIAESAIELLRNSGHKQQAQQLARQLGTPVEMLRHNDSPTIKSGDGER
jgi:hypothetical protein